MTINISPDIVEKNLPVQCESDQGAYLGVRSYSQASTSISLKKTKIIKQRERERERERETMLPRLFGRVQDLAQSTCI